MSPLWHDAVDTPCRMPARSTANFGVTVDSKCLHYLIFHQKFRQFVCWKLVFCYTDDCVDGKRFITGSQSLFLQNIGVPHLRQSNYHWHKVRDGRNPSIRTRYLNASGRYPAVNSIIRFNTSLYKFLEASKYSFQEYLASCISCVDINDKCVISAQH